ncbi:hypothetical protein [Streptomyces sp. CAU 1734]|uniref:hypothetical protein n=1 Tax=Streptomyces sp. CAU 1734 TaxID=3140360 RepID=UPI003261BFE8
MTRHDQKEPDRPERPGFRENRVLSEPATVQGCQEDFAAGAADRDTVFKQWRRAAGVC